MVARGHAAAYLQTKYRRTAVSTGNTFQDLPWLHETADNTESYIWLDITWYIALTASFASKLPDVGDPLVRQLGRYADRGLTPSPDAKAKGGRGQQASRGHRTRWLSRLNESRSALISRPPFVYPDWGFPWFFLSCKANAMVYNAKSGTARSSSPRRGGLQSPVMRSNAGIASRKSPR